MIVPRVTTALTRPELRAALLMGFRGAFECEPTYDAIGVAWSQLCLEHANGAAIHDFNIGNLDAISGWTGDVFELTAAEVIRGERVMRTKRLCAFTSAAAGAEHYWTRLADNYGSALPFFDRGDAEGAARELKALRYFTGSVEDYARSMRLLFGEYRRAWPVEAISSPRQVG